MSRDDAYLLDILESAKIALDYVSGINHGLSLRMIFNVRMQ